MKEVIPLVQVNFRKVRFIYDKVAENTASLDPSAVEVSDVLVSLQQD